MFRKHPEKPGKGLEDWRTMETRALVLDQIWVEQVSDRLNPVASAVKTEPTLEPPCPEVRKNL